MGCVASEKTWEKFKTADISGNFSGFFCWVFFFVMTILCIFWGQATNNKHFAKEEQDRCFFGMKRFVSKKGYRWCFT